jgi:hypothetical protein
VVPEFGSQTKKLPAQKTAGRYESKGNAIRSFRLLINLRRDSEILICNPETNRFNDATEIILDRSVRNGVRKPEVTYQSTCANVTLALFAELHRSSRIIPGQRDSGRPGMPMIVIACITVFALLVCLSLVGPADDLR